MRKFVTRKRLSMFFSVLGIAMMGVDLLITRNFFTHIGELMALSLLFFATGIFLDRDPKPARTSSSAKGHVLSRRGKVT